MSKQICVQSFITVDIQCKMTSKRTNFHNQFLEKSVTSTLIIKAKLMQITVIQCCLQDIFSNTSGMQLHDLIFFFLHSDLLSEG